MPSLLHIIGVAALAAVATAGLVDGARRWSLRLALLDRPNARSSHVVATPRLGGLAFAPVLLLGLALLGWLLPELSADQRRAVGVLVVAGLLVSVVSLADDVWPQPAWLRLIMHVMAAAAIALTLRSVPSIDAGPLGSLAFGRPVMLALTTLWIAWFINAFNFMDGIDGIAGSQALVAGMGWIVYGFMIDASLMVGAGALMVGTASGFLVHNWSPARIFMGDSGSALLGLLLATVPWVIGHPDLWLASLLLVWPFVFDTTLTLAKRALRGERVWEAHRSHLYQRLVIGGHSHRAVAGAYAGLSTLGLVSGAVLLVGSAALAPVAVAAIVLAGLGLVLAVSHVERAVARPARSRSDA